MKIFALETNLEKLKCSFLSDGEQEVLMTFYHGLSFLFAIVREIFLTIVLFFLGIGSWFAGFPMGITVSVLFLLWLFLVFFNLLRAWIDWHYDFICVTSDKVLLVDQSSIFRQKVNPIHLENIGSVVSVTQFWDVFHCGIVQVNLKEGEGGNKVVLKYVPDAADVATKIADALTRYQRRFARPGNEGISAEAMP